MRYTEPVATLDADVLVVLPGTQGMPHGEAILVGRWPVQFIPVFNRLTEEAVAAAETDEIDGIPMRVVSSGHLALIALSVGRAKDYLRIVSLLDAGAVSREGMEALARRHGLSDQWSRFQKRYLDE